MKKITVIAAILMTTSFGLVKAQTNQGRVLVGVSSTLSTLGTGPNVMSLGLSSTKYKSDADGYEEPEADKTISVNLSPKIGFFVANNFALGLDINVAYSENRPGESEDSFTQSILSAGPFVRYYLPSSTVKPFFELGGSYGAYNTKYDYANESPYTDIDSKLTLTTIGGGIGMAVPAGDRVMFDFLAGYNSLSYKSKEDNPDNDRIVIGTLGIKLGVNVSLGAR